MTPRGHTTNNCCTVLAAFALLLAPVAAIRGQERVSFPSTDADLTSGAPTMLTGYLYKPTGAGPFAAVIGLHGCDGLVDEHGTIHPLYGQWGQILSEAGYLVLLIDSFQPRGQGSLCAIQPLIARPVLPYRETPRDAFGGIKYLRLRPDVRKDRIAILGQSNGGIGVLSTIAQGSLPKAILQGNDFRAAIAFYPACSLVLTQYPNWRPRMRMLLLMGESDNFVPPAACKDLVSRATKDGGPPIQAHFYPGAYHGFDHPDQPPTVMTDVKLPPDGHSPTVGSDPTARADAIKRVQQFLANALK